MNKRNRLLEFFANPINNNIAIGLVKIFHPSLPDTYISPYSGKEVKTVDKIKLSIHPNYDWVCINGYGIGIGLTFPISFFGMGHGIDAFENELINNKFRAWRFATDSECINNATEYSDKFQSKVHKFLIDNNVPKPTASELYQSYYTD